MRKRQVRPALAFEDHRSGIIAFVRGVVINVQFAASCPQAGLQDLAQLKQPGNRTPPAAAASHIYRAARSHSACR